MSIYGRSKTSLTLNALAGKPQGYNALHFMIPLNFPLQVAGSFSGQFVDLTTVPPSQIAQEGDGDIHVEITVVDGSNNNAPVDISAATVLTLLFKKPDLTTQSFVAHLVTNGRDGKMGYNLNASDLDQAGYYFVQGNFTIASVAKSTIMKSFKVSENIEIEET